MTWPEISIEDFPPERDDEPSSLRQDILDELTDHFACALNRELLKNPDQQLAQQRVIKQFGDPTKVAYQLWFDAMKEKIMSQRIMTGISVVMAVCCLVVVGISWMLFQESQRMNQELLTQVAAMAERPVPVATTTMDPQFLKQMEILLEKRATQANDSSEEINPILFQLLEENKEGKPATGFKASLMKFENKRSVFSVGAVSDETGKLDFGKLPWGTYKMTLRTPWNEELSTLNITTIPGRKYEQTIFCPVGVPEKVSVEFQVDWQGKAADEGVLLLCDFRHISSSSRARRYFLSSKRTIQHDSWTYRHNLSLEAESGVYLIDVMNNQATSCPLAADGNYKDLDVQKLVWQPTVEALQGEYMSPTIYLIRKSQLSKLSEINSITTIGLITSNKNEMDLKIYSYPGMGMFVSPFEKFKVEPQLLKRLEKKSSGAAKMMNAFYSSRKNTYYQATMEEPNVWEINIPDLYPITRESGSLSSAL